MEIFHLTDIGWCALLPNSTRGRNMGNSKTLKEKTYIGFIWSFTDLMANRGMQFILQIILARLLSPVHFGLIGMVVILVAISETIIDSGFSQALIRDKNTNQTDYSTVFYFNLLLALVLYFLFFISAGLISDFFSEPQLVEIIRVLSLVIVISSFGIIQKVLLVKKVDFKTITKANIIGVLVSSSITIAMALSGYGVWSLVVNMITLEFVQNLFLWIFNKWTPSFTFSINSLRKYFRFSYKLLLSELIDTFYNNLYFLLIGRLYSTARLGFYTNALRLSDLASHSVASTVQRVSYPVLSSIQDDEERLRFGFRKLIKMSAFMNFPLLVGLAAVATPLYSLLFGDKWLPSVVYLQLLCFGGMLYPLHAINLNILQVKGRSDLFLLIEVVKKAVFTVLILIALFFKLGIIGLIGATVLNSYTSLFINTYFSGKEIAYSTKDQMKDLLPIFIISLSMGGGVYAFGNMLPFGDFLVIICQISVGVFIYILLCKLAKVEEFNVLYRMIFINLLKNKLVILSAKSKKYRRSA